MDGWKNILRNAVGNQNLWNNEWNLKKKWNIIFRNVWSLDHVQLFLFTCGNQVLKQSWLPLSPPHPKPKKHLEIFLHSLFHLRNSPFITRWFLQKLSFWTFSLMNFRQNVFFLFMCLSDSQTFYRCLPTVCQCLQVYEGTSHHQLCLSFICLSVCLFFCLPGFAGFCAHFYASDATRTVCLSVC